MDTIKIGDFLKSLRKANGFTQEEVADKLMVSPKTISRWECGDGLPDINIISSVADLYGVTVDELLKGERKNKDDGLKEESINLKNKNKDKILTHSIIKKYNIFFYISFGVSLGFTFIGTILSFFPALTPITIITLLAGTIASIILLIIGHNLTKETMTYNNELLTDELTQKINGMIRQRRMFIFDTYSLTLLVLSYTLRWCLAYFTGSFVFYTIALDLICFNVFLVICYLIVRITMLATKDKEKTKRISFKILSFIAIVSLYVFSFVGLFDIHDRGSLLDGYNTYALIARLLLNKYYNYNISLLISLGMLAIGLTLQTIFVSLNKLKLSWIPLIVVVLGNIVNILGEAGEVNYLNSLSTIFWPSLIAISSITLLIIISVYGKKQQKLAK